jgi:hypothetical protein
LIIILDYVLVGPALRPCSISNSQIGDESEKTGGTPDCGIGVNLHVIDYKVQGISCKVHYASCASAGIYCIYPPACDLAQRKSQVRIIREW